MNTDVSESHSQEIACENEGSIKIVSETKKRIYHKQNKPMWNMKNKMSLIRIMGIKEEMMNAGMDKSGNKFNQILKIEDKNGTVWGT